MQTQVGATRTRSEIRQDPDPRPPSMRQVRCKASGEEMKGAIIKLHDTSWRIQGESDGKVHICCSSIKDWENADPAFSIDTLSLIYRLADLAHRRKEEHNELLDVLSGLKDNHTMYDPSTLCHPSIPHETATELAEGVIKRLRGSGESVRAVSSSGTTISNDNPFYQPVNGSGGTPV